MPITAETLRRRSAEEMDAAARGFSDASWLRDAFLTVPREHFAPAQVWWPAPREDGLHSLIDRDERPKAWLKAVYSTGAPLITQMDDGLVPPAGPAKGAFTSSISSSGVIIELLRHLAPEPGPRVRSGDAACRVRTGRRQQGGRIPGRRRPHGLNGRDRGEPGAVRAACGVPVMVFSRSPASVRTPA